MIKFLKTAFKLYREQSIREREIAEREKIARVFNDRYTYRHEWISGKERLPGTSFGGLNPRSGYAWMCPECNKIHHPYESSIMSGLQYPKCCNTYQGDRLSQKIRTS